ncbi:MAG: prepilin-type N-terminal cleavage/methylation domain-containing protein [Deltaproteobacteria bacterium]|nr:prepilin-type N-terminal cleavage/methylation domain-containing protein [Deltaproteobacteria bacterium]
MKVTWKQHKAGEKGFTLLEVMVAIAVISISLIVLLYAQNSNITRSYHSRCLTRAALLGQKILSESSLSEPEPGTWEGKEELDDMTLRWEKRVEPSIVEGMRKLTIRVSWGDEMSGSVFLLETFRAV